MLSDHFLFPSSGLAGGPGYPISNVPAANVLGLPMGISFLGTASSEPTLIKLASGFEAATLISGVRSGVGLPSSLMLRLSTRPEWLQAVTRDFDAFLVDHAACERKASATALTFVSHYPDRTELVSAMIQLAREELDHFQQVHREIANRGLLLGPDSKDAYVLKLREQIRRGPELYLLDRLLVAGVVEARGCERFGMIAESLPPGRIKELYETLARSEAQHHRLFLGLANRYFTSTEVAARLDSLLDAEAKIVSQLPLRAALH